MSLLEDEIDHLSDLIGSRHLEISLVYKLVVVSLIEHSGGWAKNIDKRLALFNVNASDTKQRREDGS